jgi:hypothetical protein
MYKRALDSSRSLKLCVWVIEIADGLCLRVPVSLFNLSLVLLWRTAEREFCLADRTMRQKAKIKVRLESNSVLSCKTVLFDDFSIYLMLSFGNAIFLYQLD